MKTWRERVRERVDGERLAGHGGGLEQRQPGERPGQAGRVGLDDPVAVDDAGGRSAHSLAAGGVADDLDRLMRSG